MKQISPKVKSILTGTGLTFLASGLTILLHNFNFFDATELKLYDFRFQLRGPITGEYSLDPISRKPETFTDLNNNSRWDLNEEYEDQGNGIWNSPEIYEDSNSNGKFDQGEPFTDAGNGKYDSGINVVLVEIDDESWRLIDESWPYPRGRIWARCIKNLAAAGAKVIFFDIEFDKPDHQSENIIKEFGENTIEGFIHGDIHMKEAIQFARDKGSSVVLGSKIAFEPTRVPPEYYLTPTKMLMEADPLTGVVDVPNDLDGVNRRYLVFNQMAEDTTWYLSGGVKSVLEYFDINWDNSEYEFLLEERQIVIQDLENNNEIIINTYGDQKNTFLINYYGPASVATPSLFSESKAFKTFNRYPLANVIDNADYDLSEFMEDTDWMDQFLPGNIPDYILAIEDMDQRQMMMDLMGIGSSDLSNSPFNNKIVVIGTSLEEHQDLKVTPLFSLWGEKHLMPGMEVHANAIQQMLHNNYIQVMNSTISFSKISFWKDLTIIILLSIITYLLFSAVSPAISGLLVGLEVLIWMSYSVGAFINDYLWIGKFLIAKILPDFTSESLFIVPPGFNESILVPVVFPIASIIITYGVNLSYKLFTEGQDKKFLKDTFGTYISPELIDDMFDNKTPPLLGGSSGMRTAVFTDIASFSTFSEILSATELVELLNEYLTEMTNILLENNGTLDKYEGDAICAFFGAPVDQPDNAHRALTTAVKMQNSCEKMRQKWDGEGDKWPDIVKNMRTRIGVNWGEMVNGNMGSTQRMNYTMMGDTVNTAARLESGAKQYGIYTATTLETLEEAGSEQFEWRIVDKTRYMGKSDAITTVELLGLKNEINENLVKCISIFNNGFELYQKMEWDNAINKFMEAEKLEEEFSGRPTNPSKKLIERCEEYKISPPAPTAKEWDGVYTMTKK